LKQPTFFIAASALSGDILATEIVLALKAKFPTCTGFGICGPSMRRAKITHLLDIEDVPSVPWSGESRRSTQFVLDQVRRIKPDIAIFVGYSDFCFQLISSMHQDHIPTILYNPPVLTDWRQEKIEELKDSTTQVLGIYPYEQQFADLGFNYQYVGSPHKERTGKVIVKPATFGIVSSDMVISYLPGSRKSHFRKLFPQIARIHKFVGAKLPNAKFLLPLSENLTVAELVKSGIMNPQELTERGGAFYWSNIQILHGMSLETLAISRAAITPPGTTSIEAALLGIPHVIILTDGAPGPGSLVNETLGDKMIKTFSLAAPAEDIADQFLQLVHDDNQRQRQIENFRKYKELMGDFSPDEVADLIGKFTKWQLGRRKRSM
jgi:lipid-A-disaccharide synthase